MNQNQILRLVENALGDDDAPEAVKSKELQLVIKGDEIKNLERSQEGFKKLISKLNLKGKTKLEGKRLLVSIQGVDDTKWVSVVRFIEADAGVDISKHGDKPFRIPFSDMYLTVGYNNSKKLFDDSLLENMNDHHSTGQSYEEYNKPAPAQSNSRKEFLVDGEPVQADSEEQALHIALKQGAKEVIFKLDGKVKGEWTWNDGEKSFERDVLGDNGSSEEECKTEGLAQVFINGQLVEGAYGDSNRLNIKNPTDISYWFEHSVEPILFITKKLVLDSPEANKEVVAKILAKAKSDELEDIEGWYKQCDADDKRDCSKAIKWFAGKSDKEKAEGCADMLSDANYHSMAKLVRTLF